VFEALIAPWKIRLAAALKSAVCVLVALFALSWAIVFAAAAVFVSAQARYGTINACLGFAAFFVLLTVIALVVMAILRGSAERQAAATRASAAAAPWLDPRVIAAGLSFGKTLGGRRALSLGLAGAFLVGLLMSRGTDRK
jgi:hypothetical protein